MSEPSEIADCINTLTAIHHLCQQGTAGIELQSVLNELKSGLRYALINTSPQIHIVLTQEHRYSVVSMGILCWISANLCDSNYYTTTYNTATINIHLSLLNKVLLLILWFLVVFDSCSYYQLSQVNPQQRIKILTLLTNCLQLDIGLAGIVVV